MAVWMSWTLSCVPVDSPAVERTAALSIRELPVTTMDSGAAHTPGAVSCAYKGAALIATSDSMTEANFCITQIYTNQFGGSPHLSACILIRQRGCQRYASLRQPS